MIRAGSTRRIIRKSGGAVYTAQALALFAAMTTPPTTARKILINTAISSLLTAGIWNNLDVLYVLAAANAQASLLNWVAPTGFVAAGVNSPAFVADQGYTGNGSTSYVRSNFTLSTQAVKLTQNNASVWVWSRTSGQEAAGAIGNASSPRTFITPRNASNNMICGINNGSASLTISNTDGSGLLGSSRSNATTQNAWRNGASIGSGAVGSSTLATDEQWIGAANATGFGTRQIAMAAWGASLSGLEASFYNIMLAYMQGVGAA